MNEKMVLEWAHLESSLKDVWKKRAIKLGGGGGQPMQPPEGIIVTIKPW